MTATPYRPGNLVAIFAITLLLAAQPAHARYITRALGLVIPPLITVGYIASRYLSDDFDDYVQQQRRLSENSFSPAPGIELLYRPERQVVSYTTANNKMIPRVTRISKIESLAWLANFAHDRKAKVDQLLLSIETDYKHWQQAHPKQPASHFKRYMASLSAYCETGGSDLILAFHPPEQDERNFRNTCRKWLDHTIDKTELLLGTNTRDPLVLAPVWRLKQNRLLATPLIYFVLNPEFTPPDSFSLYDQFPVDFNLQGADAYKFLLYPLISVFHRFRATQLINAPDQARPAQILDSSILYSNFGTRGNITAPYMLESSIDKEQFLIFRQQNQLEVWPVYGAWTSTWSPPKIQLKEGRFTLTVENRTASPSPGL